MSENVFTGRDLFYLKSYSALDAMISGCVSFKLIVEIAWFMEIAMQCSKKKLKNTPKKIERCRNRIYAVNEINLDDEIKSEEFLNLVRDGISCATGVLDMCTNIELADAGNELMNLIKSKASSAGEMGRFYFMRC